jgi:hypothetical protein
LENEKNNILIVYTVLTSSVFGQESNSKLFYCKSGLFSKTNVLFTINNGNSKITVIYAFGIDAYNIKINSDLTKTDTIINGLNILYKSEKDSVFIASNNKNYFYLSKDNKKYKLKQTDIKSNQLKELWMMSPNMPKPLDKLIGFN